MYVSEKRRWIREDQLIACLGNVSALCESQLAALGRMCTLLRIDARCTAALGRDARIINAVADELTALRAAERGEYVLRLTVVQRTLRRLLDRADTLQCLARLHPDALAMFITSIDLQVPMAGASVSTESGASRRPRRLAPDA